MSIAVAYKLSRILGIKVPVTTKSILNSILPVVFFSTFTLGEKASGLVILLSSRICKVAPPVAAVIVTIASVPAFTLAKR